jgi:hypothetical protein
MENQSPSPEQVLYYAVPQSPVDGHNQPPLLGVPPTPTTAGTEKTRSRGHSSASRPSTSGTTTTGRVRTPTLPQAQLLSQSHSTGGGTTSPPLPSSSSPTPKQLSPEQVQLVHQLVTTQGIQSPSEMARIVNAMTAGVDVGAGLREVGASGSGGGGAGSDRPRTAPDEKGAS